jgi:gamma-glutamylcyclotransferase (GGCT)/AIG2-like uncharacterized protein YtfP
MVLYFAYGSNLNLKQIRDRTKNFNLKPKFIAFLPDYKLIFPRESNRQGGGVASIEKAEGREVWGAVFELNEQEKSRIDVAEGYSPNRNKDQNSYNLEEIEVKKKDGSKIKVITYIANKKGSFFPSQQYMNKIINGAIECNLPKEYIEKLKKIKTRKIL